MEWAVAIPVIALLLLCPLMMIAMMVGGWIFGRRLTGGHGMTCMGTAAMPATRTKRRPAAAIWSRS